MADNQTTQSTPDDKTSSTDPSSLKGLTMAVGIDPAKPGEDSLLGCDIGGVRIVRLIAEGGMGRVYEGKQEKPNRTVAVKVMRPGLTSPSILKRFEYEAEVLGRLQHPGIAHIYSVGVHRMGNATVPYFVMEHIADARSLTDYAEDLKLPTRQRLDLFRSVCDAVAHGHQKGVIHRDLKPSNILVDSTGQPKVIDFGVARATDSDMALTTMQTDVGQLIGTLQYMSPEQFDADPNDIDVRSDVYALGVILYELLAGKMPYDVKKKAIYEVMRIVKEEEPTPLSSFNRALRGDVAVIAGKCLEKERGRRYSSASELGSDVGRYLAGDAISASVPSFVDGLVRLARKHRVAAAAVAGVFTSLVLAVGGIALFYVRAENQRIRAVANEAAATTERDRARRVLNFLQESFSAPDPTKIGREVTVADVLTRLPPNMAAHFQDDPITEAEVLATIGATLESLGLYDHADTATCRAIALVESPDIVSHPGVAELRASSSSTLAKIRLFQGRFREAAELFNSVVHFAELAMPAEILFRVRNLNGLALASLRDGRREEAGQALDKAANLIRKYGHEDTLEAIETQQYQAIPSDVLEHDANSHRLIVEALERGRRVLGNDHRKTAELMSDMAAALQNDGKYDEAEGLFIEALKIDELVLGPEHWDVARVLNNLGVLYRTMNRLDEAEQAAERALAIFDRQFGPDYPHRSAPMMTLGVIKVSKEQPDEAEKTLRSALAIQRKANPCDSITGPILDWILFIFARRGDMLGMSRELAEAWSLTVKSCGGDDARADQYLEKLYILAIVSRMPELATPVFREAIDLAIAGSGSVSERRAIRLAQLAHLLCLGQDVEEAEALAKQAIEIMRPAFGCERETLEALCTRAEALLMLGRSAEASSLVQELLAVTQQQPNGTAALMLRVTALHAVTTDLLRGPTQAAPLYESVIESAKNLVRGTTFDFHQPCGRPDCARYAEILIATMCMNVAQERIGTLSEASSSLLVQQANAWIEQRHYLHAEAVLRQAASAGDARPHGITETLDKLMLLLGRERVDQNADTNSAEAKEVP